MNLGFPGSYYKLGIRDAQKNRYPLYSVLLAAGEYNKAAQYLKGWGEVTGRDLRTWQDHK